jgi:DNA-directed RNA polymerase subunit M/transcription elongation factor TFIIS
MTEDELAFFHEQKVKAKTKQEQQKQTLNQILPPSLRACVKCHTHHLSSFAPQRRASDEPCHITYICEQENCRYSWSETG